MRSVSSRASTSRAATASPSASSTSAFMRVSRAVSSASTAGRFRKTLVFPTATASTPGTCRWRSARNSAASFFVVFVE